MYTSEREAFGTEILGLFFMRKIIGFESSVEQPAVATQLIQFLDFMDHDG